ncbi:hypothetical protein PJL18_04037 [Paenarthrobacter nicotinovorans]|nr:hypothetical protein [Paenarthrobacter nicotinovorans]
MHYLAEVPAVGEEFRAIGGGGPDAVVPPLPDEAAVQPGVTVHQVLVLVDRARAVAHGVHILAQDEGLGALPGRLRSGAAEQKGA